MYNINFLCTYKLHSTEDQVDMYRIQYLQAIEQSKWDDEEVELKMKNLFDKIHLEMSVIIDKARKSQEVASLLTIMGDDDFTVFKTLFRFETFDLTHRCVCDVLNHGMVSHENAEVLMNAL